MQKKLVGRKTRYERPRARRASRRSSQWHAELANHELVDRLEAEISSNRKQAELNGEVPDDDEELQATPAKKPAAPLQVANGQSEGARRCCEAKPPAKDEKVKKLGAPVAVGKLAKAAPAAKPAKGAQAGQGARRRR